MMRARHFKAASQGRLTDSWLSNLALLLGDLGVHKFYLGRPGQGILYILFCWTFIPSFVAMIEGIIYLCTSEQNFQAKYG